jgi:hypothetical protein
MNNAALFLSVLLIKWKLFRFDRKKEKGRQTEIILEIFGDVRGKVYFCKAKRQQPIKP